MSNQTAQDVAMIARNAIDRILRLEADRPKIPYAEVRELVDKICDLWPGSNVPPPQSQSEAEMLRALDEIYLAAVAVREKMEAKSC